MCQRYCTLIFLLSLFITGVICPDLSGQGYVITHYNSRSGIGHDMVRAIAADSSGFIWMATWDGLTRYDGTDFINYSHDPADSTTIPYFSVSHVGIDRKNNLWLATDNAILTLFNRATGKFSHIRSLDRYAVNDLVCFNPGPDGNMWFVLKKGILKHDPVSDETLFYPWTLRQDEMPVMRFSGYRLIFDGSGRPWLAGNDILKLEVGVDPADGKAYTSIESTSTIRRLPGRIGTFFDETGYSTLVSDSSGNMWLASLTGLFRFDETGECFTEYGGDPRIIRFACDNPIVFYNHDKGLNICFPAKDSLIIIPREVSGLPATYLMHDPGLLWVARAGQGGTPDGVIKMVFTPYEFRHINPFPDRYSKLNVFSIITDERKALWIASRDRNYLIRIPAGGVPEKKLILNDREIKDLWHPRAFLADTGAIWIGYYYNMLLYYNLETGETEKHYPAKVNHTICYDRDGSILIADNGILRYNPVTRESTRLFTIRDSVNIFTFLRQGNILWAGCSYSYLLKYNLDTGEHELIKLAHGITNFEDICEGPEGELWIATLGTGVCRYNPSSGEKIFYTTSSGLSNNTTYCTLCDPDGNIWVSTNNGLSVINPVTGLIRSFGENDGLPIHEFNSDASLITGEGMFLFGGVGGVVEFDPLKVLHGNSGYTRHKIIIKELDVSGISKTFESPVYMMDTVILDKGSDNFRISFVVSEYRSPQVIRYRYRLGGDEANWYYTGHTDRNINFSNLSPGWYNLEIEATDINGSWSNRRVLTIRIKPFFYQTTAFRVATPLTLLLILSVLGWILLRQLAAREQQKRDILRHQALRGQMNPHFIFNALNSINYFISNNDRLSANRYIADFSKLIRSVLNNMSEDFVRLSVEVEALEDYLKIEHLRFGDKFDYEVEIEPEVHKDHFRISPGLVQPFVENAIWHGVMGLNDRKGLIRVEFKMKGTILLCIVEDDGVGRTRSEAMKDKSLPRKSRGISLATDRMKIINNLLLTDYRITISDLYPDRKETGTRVEIEMPMSP
ncbi:MAG: histidine kinase [Bacteroidales bacterium]|jgi:ligand-binding sensor domain-containing protein|nr:histidine kinase [Bacteroidales bacterium]